MAMVKKLSLQGVRSFSPAEDKGQWIEFGSPLTLILGVNGSGKTTIIEALKYAITSQFPPNSAKGASFVNDPKLTYGDKALAKIILHLQDAQGNKYITSRKVQALIKNAKGDLSMSQLEGTLRVTNANGESRQISNKVQDIKFEMCRLMGVSEAILNHVIFCHQEESCWPLDEGKKVKTTFDAIFNTLAYKKCFDRLAAVDKELTIKIKVEAEGLRFVIDNREKARHKRLDLDDKKIELQVKNDSIATLERDIKEMEEKLRQFQALEQEFAKKQSEVIEKRTKLKGTEEHIQKLRKEIKEEFTGSLTDLKKHMSNFQQECLQKLNLLKKLERDSKRKEDEWTKLNQTRSALLKEEGMFQQEENANNKNVQLMKDHLMQIVPLLRKVKDEVESDEGEGGIHNVSFMSNLEACDTEAGGDMSYESVMKTLNSALKWKESEQRSVQERFGKEEKDLQQLIDEVRSKYASVEKERDMKRQQLADSKKAFEELKIRLRDLEGSTERLCLLDDEEENFLSQIEQIENSGFMMKVDSEIKTLAGEIKTLEDEISGLNHVVNILANDKGKTDQVNLLNRQKMQKQSDCNEEMRKMEDDLKTVLEVDEIPQDGLAVSVDRKFKSLTNELKSKKVELRENEQSLASAKSELKYVTSDLVAKERNLKVNKEKIQGVLEELDYNSVYTDVSNQLDETQSECYFAESASYLYKKFIQRLGKKDCCPLCKRDMESKQAVRKLVDEMEHEITRMKQNVPKIQEKVEGLKKRQQQVLKSKPWWDQVQTLEQDIPKLSAKKAELEETVEKLTDENEGMSMITSEIESRLQMLQKCKSGVALYEQCKREIKKIDDQIAKVEKQRDPEAKNSSMTLADAQTEVEQLQTKISNKRSEKENKEDIRNKKRDELSKLQEKKNKVKEEKLRITAELQNRDALEQQKKEKEATTKELEGKITELARSLPGIKIEIGKAEKNRASCSQRKEDSLKRLRDDKGVLDKQKDIITELHKRIQDFEKKRGKFVEVQQRVTECKELLKTCNEERQEIVKQIDSHKDEIANQELKKRELNDNLTLKEKLEEASILKQDLKEKEKILQQAETRGAATEKRELQQKHHKDSARFNELLGSRTELQKSIKELERELATPMFANAEREYTERIAKKTIYEKSQRDVRRYKTALDQAIMQFHLKKMEKINKILFEYWRRIYKGNDIDKIMIKTEADQQDAAGADGGKGKASKGKVSASGIGRKIYNYRVVMVRRGVEIDMRGRCSAGQRVLASIIIRIALAESFGAKCGIITLDEPTTNLDQKNINSLADALADLTEKMGSRKNFQLIVITHDQEFTQRLTAVDAVEKYWRVERDNEGFSRVSMVLKRGYGASYVGPSNPSALGVPSTLMSRGR